MPLKCRCVCGCKLLVSMKTAGKSVKCPQCDRRLRVPKDAVQRRRKQLAAKEKEASSISPTRSSRLSRPSSATQLAGPESPPIQNPQPPLPGQSATPEPAAKPSEKKPPSRQESSATKGRRQTPPPLPKRGPKTHESDSEVPADNKLVAPVSTPAIEPQQDDEAQPSEGRPEEEDQASPEEPLQGPEATDNDPEEVDVPVRGYQPDRDKVATVRWLACALAGIALFGLVPAIQDVVAHFQSEISAGISRWASTLMLVGMLQLAYAIYLVQLPDWSSVWVVTVLSLLIAGGYAAMCGLTFLAGEQSQFVQVLELADRLRGGKATGWCLIMLLLTSLMSYSSARVAARWRRALAI